MKTLSLAFFAISDGESTFDDAAISGSISFALVFKICHLPLPFLNRLTFASNYAVPG